MKAVAALTLMAAVVATSGSARAELASVGSINLLGMHASHFGFSDPTLRARQTYEVIAGLPTATPIDQSFRGFISPVVDAQFKVRPDLIVSFPLGISSRNVFMADFVSRREGTLQSRVAVGPSDGFGRGGLVTFWTAF